MLYTDKAKIIKQEALLLLKKVGSNKKIGKKEMTWFFKKVTDYKDTDDNMWVTHKID